MAKRRKKARKTGRRRSRVSGLGQIDMMNILGVAAGAVAAGFADKFIPDTLDKRISAGIKIAAGVALPMLVKGGNTKNLLAGVGSGMIAVGAVDLLKGFGVLQGAEDDLLEVTLNGDDLSVVNGDQDILAGVDILAGDDLSVVNEAEDEEGSY
jgi:hypothetical protein